jgi:hypothetical protein
VRLLGPIWSYTWTLSVYTWQEGVIATAQCWQQQQQHQRASWLGECEIYTCCAAAGFCVAQNMQIAPCLPTSTSQFSSKLAETEMAVTCSTNLGRALQP